MKGKGRNNTKRTRRIDRNEATPFVSPFFFRFRNFDFVSTDDPEETQQKTKTRKCHEIPVKTQGNSIKLKENHEKCMKNQSNETRST